MAKPSLFCLRVSAKGFFLVAPRISQPPPHLHVFLYLLCTHSCRTPEVLPAQAGYASPPQSMGGRCKAL